MRDANDLVHDGGLSALLEQFDAMQRWNFFSPDGQCDADDCNEDHASGKKAERKTDVDSEIRRLADLTIFEYERQRKPAAEQLGLRAQVLDRLVAAAREDEVDEKQGHSLKLPEPEPWPEPVDGVALLSGLAAAIRRHVVLSNSMADATALWAVHTHLVNCFGISPRLGITSPEKGCGKTTLLDVLWHIVFRPLLAANVTASAVFRVVESQQPTLLIDEADTFLSESEELRGVLNSGHRRGGSVVRTVGDDFEPRAFSTYSATAIALIGSLPPTLTDRSIPIELQRRRSDEPVEAFRFGHTRHLEDLGRMVARWALDNSDAVGALDPQMPPGIFNRVADNWRPLLAIADVVGSDWGERARVAIGLADGAEESKGVQLLRDIRAIFVERAVDRISSEELVDALIAIENHPWAEWRREKPITKNGLARILAKYKICPEGIRIGNHTPRGYLLAWFDDAFRRYLK
jgi:putative DNA primase/helicase